MKSHITHKNGLFKGVGDDSTPGLAFTLAHQVGRWFVPKKTKQPPWIVVEAGRGPSLHGGQEENKQEIQALIEESALDVCIHTI